MATLTEVEQLQRIEGASALVDNTPSPDLLRLVHERSMVAKDYLQSKDKRLLDLYNDYDNKIKQFLFLH